MKYRIEVVYDAVAGYYVANLPEVEYCAADGPTPEAAVAAVTEKLAVLEEVLHEQGRALPVPAAERPVTADILRRASSLVNLSALARQSGLSPQTLATKIKRGTEFAPRESVRLARSLRRRGLLLAQ
jgi:predicted RNase H-like HicB family nuclease